MSSRTTPLVPSFIYGTAWKEERTGALTELALRTGFRGIDTANQRRHYYEAGVGEALAAACQAGVTSREDLFLQTKFTYRDGQDHRLPYDPQASVAAQVEQSLASSLEHLGTDYVDSFVLHGPASGYGWSDIDAEAWESMIKQRDAGRARLLGVSNVSLRHLTQMAAVHQEIPSFVQNRCYAITGWDREIRSFCAERNIIYQGFSLLTANWQLLGHPVISGIANERGWTPAQVVFAFSRAAGILPLTGTSDAGHMTEDLASVSYELPADDIAAIETLAG